MNTYIYIYIYIYMGMGQVGIHFVWGPLGGPAGGHSGPKGDLENKKTFPTRILSTSRFPTSVSSLDALRKAFSTN